MQICTFGVVHETTVISWVVIYDKLFSHCLPEHQQTTYILSATPLDAVVRVLRTAIHVGRQQPTCYRHGAPGVRETGNIGADRVGTEGRHIASRDGVLSWSRQTVIRVRLAASDQRPIRYRKRRHTRRSVTEAGNVDLVGAHIRIHIAI